MSAQRTQGAGQARGGDVFGRARVAAWLDEALARARALGADGAEAGFVGERANYVRMADSRIVQASDVDSGRVTVRAVVRGHEGRATTSRLDRAGLAAAAAAAVGKAEGAGLATEAGEVSLPAPVTVEPAGAWSLDEATAGLDAATKGAWLADALQASERDGLALAGRFHSGLRTVAVRSTEGVDAFHQGSWGELTVSVLERPAGHRASSYRQATGARLDEACVSALGEEARQACHRARDPQPLELGRWDVVLAPPAVAELMTWLGTIGFGARAMEDGTSFMAGRLGEPLMGEHVSITDDASMRGGSGGVPMPFDAQGMPKRPVPLIARGRAAGVVHDVDTARRAGCATTGHAPFHDPFGDGGPTPRHLVLGAGEGDRDAMIARVDRGLLIHRFHYVNGMVEPRRAVMTGLLRDDVLRIDGGRLGGSVGSARFTESMLDAFSRIADAGAIGREAHAVSNWFGPMQCTMAPWVLLPGLAFTSGR